MYMVFIVCAGIGVLWVYAECICKNVVADAYWFNQIIKVWIVFPSEFAKVYYVVSYSCGLRLELTYKNKPSNTHTYRGAYKGAEL